MMRRTSVWCRDCGHEEHERDTCLAHMSQGKAINLYAQGKLRAPSPWPPKCDCRMGVERTLWQAQQRERRGF